ncbi:MAG: multidrug resistance efflux pump [Mariniblastus sp.]|jgi:multidrug resistance efflux pump
MTLSHLIPSPSDRAMSQSPTHSSQAKQGTRPVGFRAGKSFEATAGGRNGQSATNPNVPQPSVSASASQALSATPIGMSARSAPPMKKRAKGSGFLSALFLLAFFGVGYYVWVSILQYQTFGVIEGRVIAVASPWDGTVANWQVRDGEVVTQGQVLAQISNIDMLHQLAAYGDELKMSQALLDAEMSKVKFEAQNQTERSQKSVAEYLKSYGELLSEKARFEQLDLKFERTKNLARSNNISRAEYEQIFFQLAGQRKKIEKLSDAVEVLKIRSTDLTIADHDGAPRLKPILAKIELTQSRIARLRERIDQGQIKSPVSGRISKRSLLTGESARLGETVIEVLEDNSVEAVLYVPQKLVAEFVVGHEIEIMLEPQERPIRCVVSRFGDRFEPAPTSIQRYYQVNQPLLPVYLKPCADAQQSQDLRIGGVVKRPYEYKKAIESMVDDAKSFTRLFQSHTEPNEMQVDVAEAFTVVQQTPFTSEAGIESPQAWEPSDNEMPSVVTQENFGSSVFKSNTNAVPFGELPVSADSSLGDVDWPEDNAKTLEPKREWTDASLPSFRTNAPTDHTF